MRRDCARCHEEETVRLLLLHVSLLLLLHLVCRSNHALLEDLLWCTCGRLLLELLLLLKREMLTLLLLL